MDLDDTYQRIHDNPKFKALVAGRSRFAWTLSAIILLAYFGFITVIGFDPKLLGTPIQPGMVMTWGIPAGLALIALSFILTGIYVWRANGTYDRIVREILEEAKS